MLDVLVLIASLGPADTGKCAEPPRIGSGVAALHGEVIESEAFTLAQIQAMARRSGQALAHPPLGFYRASFGYEVTARTVTEASSDGARCGTLTTITARLTLTDRAVIIASDLRQHGCDHNAVARHYRKRAAADDQALSDGVQLLQKTLVAAWPTLHDRLPISGAPDDAELLMAIEPAVTKAIEAVELSRMTAISDVDNPAEVLALAALCTTRS